MKRLLLALMVVNGLLLLAHPTTAPAVAQPTPDSKVTVVRATYDVLLDKFFAPIDPRDLLAAAWNRVGSEAERASRPRPAALPELPEDREAAFAAFSSAYQAYEAASIAADKRLDLAFAASDAMANSLNEQHTGFLTPAQYRSFLASLGGSGLPEGLGLRLSARAPWFITAVAPGGPSDRAGLVPGDTLLAADGQDISRATAAERSRALAGASGTSVRLTVQRGDQQREVVVERGPFYFPPLNSRMLPDGVGYLRLDQFVTPYITLPNGTEVLSDLDRRLDELDANGARALILDLRGNGGGSVTTASELLGRFMQEDQLTVVRYDERGRATPGIVSGLMRAVQHPLVVLVDGGSASSSEVTASTLRESGRAVLVGTRTAGALATSQILPLPEEAGIQVGVAEQVTARTRFKIDGVGFPVDIEARDTRTAEDYLTGRDSQIDAAVAALATAPAPPPVKSTPTGSTAAELRALLDPYMPDPASIPLSDRLPRVIRSSSAQLVHPNQLIGTQAADPLALQATLRRRGYLGTHYAGYSPDVLVSPDVSVSADLYATEEGAADAVRSNDYSLLYEPAETAVRLGDYSAAYRGIWRNLGGTVLTWQRGRMVFTVSYDDVPGFERPDTVLAVAQEVDRLYSQNPVLPSGTQQMKLEAAR